MFFFLSPLFSPAQVIQRRVNGSVNFYRPYFDYVLGFGNLLKEFYLGNEFIHALTNQHNYELLIILFDGEGNSRFANYRPFRLGDYSSDYQLFVRGYSGNAGKSFLSKAVFFLGISPAKSFQR